MVVFIFGNFILLFGFFWILLLWFFLNFRDLVKIINIFINKKIINLIIMLNKGSNDCEGIRFL